MNKSKCNSTNWIGSWPRHVNSQLVTNCQLGFLSIFSLFEIFSFTECRCQGMTSIERPIQEAKISMIL